MARITYSDGVTPGVTNTFDRLGRLIQINHGTNTTTRAKNTANERTRAVLADGSYWVYEYDRLGQVTGGRKYWRDGSPVAGQQFGYAYDDIGNRKTASSGGDELGLALRTSTYAANSLNQYTSRTVPGYLDILGAATNTATVLVNNRPTSRKDEYFRAELPPDNSQGAVWQGITNVAYLAQTTNVVATNQGNLFLPRTPETFSHDTDGNLTNDGRWVYTWDAENRLTQVESLATGPTASKRRVTYTYDWHGRRVRRQEYDGSSGNYVLTNDLRMAYDGWQCLGDLTTNLVLQRAYVWGLDLSGGRTGAGGVAGLLWLRSINGTHFTSYDGNGNVTSLIDATSGSRSGIYEYGPFGQTLRLEGIAGAENGWRFSTKRIDPATELVLYEYRVYNSAIGRWLTVDPLEEIGGINLHSFARNDSIINVDSDGRIVRDDWIEGRQSRNNPDLVAGPFYFPPGSNWEVPWGPSNSKPSFDDHVGHGDWIRNHPSGMVNQNSWFETRWRGWFAAAQEQGRLEIERRLAAACRLGTRPSLFVLPYSQTVVPGLMGNTPGQFYWGGPRNPGRNETDYGDEPEGLWEARFQLGRFRFEIQKVTINWNGSDYEWSAVLLVADGLGATSTTDNFAAFYLAQLNFVHDQTLIRAKWELHGRGSCCRLAAHQMIYGDISFDPRFFDSVDGVAIPHLR